MLRINDHVAECDDELVVAETEEHDVDKIQLEFAFPKHVQNDTIVNLVNMVTEKEKEQEMPEKWRGIYNGSDRVSGAYKRSRPIEAKSGAR